ncbi:MAG: chromosome segregation protein [Chloroflexota bacterium]|nr:chromosome segregation protein [Chloroflexota bacterium]
MRFLKTLQLHGYKTFASKTDFAFDAGVTAIVGPNGSGKSNVADSLRWVLGEQSFSALRGKRTEDMIFSGSEQRARLGMAYVSLTFDNTSGWLPIDFSEVEIARRAYRSGENEYYLNGNRVRLRDISELLGSSGLSERTYSIIGQGLIDQALSQRPEERRKLFEEAAGITVHQSKRDQAQQKLQEARANLTRAHDIISELTPRLRYLKGQARRAQEFQQIRADLDAQLRTWYGYKWRQGVIGLAAAQNRLADYTGIVAEENDALNTLLKQTAARQTERAGLRDRLSDWHRASSQLHRQAEVVQRELAVRAEQIRLWSQQRAELEEELIHLRAGLEDGAERLRSAQAALAEANTAHGAQAERVAAAKRDLDEQEKKRQAQAIRLAQAQDATLTLRTQLADRRSRLSQAGERRAELGRGESEQTQAAQAGRNSLADLEKQIEALAEKVAAGEAELAKLEAARQTHGQALALAQEAERKAAEALNTAQRALARLHDQQELLERLRDEGAGLNAGARAVMAAARPRGETERASANEPPRSKPNAPRGPASLQGIIGALGELIEVPPELDRALEAALGGRMQDIVVEGWEEAEAAVAFLKQTQAGRATFLPLDSLRPGRAVDAPKGPGILGLASDLIHFDPRIRPAVELALNHVIVVADLATARRLLRGDSRATLVTVEGDIVRPGGSVTGGSDAKGRDSGLLSRARTLRELPPQIADQRKQVAAHEAAVAEARQAQEAARVALNALRSQRDELSASQQRLTAERNRLSLAADRARQTIAWHQERLGQVRKEIAGLDQAEATLGAAISSLTDQLAGQEAAVEATRRALAGLATDDLLNELARLRAEAAVSAGQLQSQQTRVAEIVALQRQRASEIATKEARLKTLGEQQTHAGQDVGVHDQKAGTLAAEIAALSALIDPAETRLARLEQEQRAGEGQERSLREQLRHTQMRQSQAELAVQRATDEQSHLRGEVEKELGLVVFESDELAANQPPLPIDGMVTRLPAVAELPDGLDESVRQLRAQIGRLGPVNLEALSEYNEVEARFNFLTSQSADLERAVADLEEVIAELDGVMKREFLSAFKVIAAQFKEEFTNLFGGGTARLLLTDPEDPSTTGVEIIARPPGKREQGLALLSGGERALTAAALIFSILKARPTPFCVLDEVDAALDEANIGRFRDALRGLTKQTQFILITHNRGTIEAADTIYGISMGADNTSQALSLKLEGLEVAPAGPAELG